MSRDEAVTWKRALVVYTGAAMLLPVVTIGWFARSAIEDIRGESSAAVARVAAVVQTVQLDVARVDVRHEALAERVTRVETRQDALEQRVGWRMRIDALPADRRRVRASVVGSEGG